MPKRAGRRKHVPYRSCVACRASRPKRELVRIVRTADGTVVIDERGKQNGRGAYLCAQRSCWTAAVQKRSLDRALAVEVNSETMDVLRAFAEELPEVLEESPECEL
jgi:predicted RNA-binding protein YlxR (DUF448 family)